MWVSYFVNGYLGRPRLDDLCWVYPNSPIIFSVWGSVNVGTWSGITDPDEQSPGLNVARYPTQPQDNHWLLGFGFDLTDWSVVVPHWFLALIFAVLPAVWFMKWRKRRKLGPNSCGSCGYDLTANETGECPECGKSIGTEAAQT